jgi:hypothetical protein
VGKPVPSKVVVVEEDILDTSHKCEIVCLSNCVISPECLGTQEAKYKGSVLEDGSERGD